MNDDGHEMINDYLKLVRWHLPDDIAEEIIDELRSYIVEEAEEHSESGVSLEGAKKAISRLGAPSEVAAEYVKSMSTGTRSENARIQEATRRILLPKWLTLSISVITFIVPYLLAVNFLVAVTWVWDIWGDPGYGFVFLTPEVLIIGIISGFFNIAFGIQTLRYLRYKTPWWNAVTFGLFTFAVPILLSITTLVAMATNPHMRGFVLPIPIQFIIGMLLIYSRENKILGWTAKRVMIEVPAQ